MKHFLFTFILLFGDVVQAQKVPIYIREHFTNCYTERPTNLKKLLNIDGYYEEVYLMPNNYKDNKAPFKLHILFYADGTFVYNFIPHTPREYSKHKYMNECSYLNEAYKDPHKYRFYMQAQWGIYRLQKDTLIMQSIHPKGSMNADPWYAIERRYKIVDKNTIERIKGSIIYLSKVSQRSRQEAYQESLRDESLPATYIPCAPIPPPDCWLKGQDWLWCRNRSE